MTIEREVLAACNYHDDELVGETPDGRVYCWWCRTDPGYRRRAESDLLTEWRLRTRGDSGDSATTQHAILASVRRLLYCSP